MIPAPPLSDSELVSGFLVASAGNPSRGDEGDDLDLFAAMLVVEEEARAKEWAALEYLLPFREGDRLIMPKNGHAQTLVFRAL